MWPETPTTRDPRIGVQDHVIEPPSGDLLDAGDVLTGHLRSPNGYAEEAYVRSLIKTARLLCERHTKRACGEQTRERWLERFPDTEIVLPYPPLLEVVSVTYVDSGGTTQTLTEDEDYLVVAPSGPMAGPGRVVVMPDTAWPTTRVQPDAVKVRYRCGYVAVDGSPADLEIPADLVHGMLLIVGELFKQRSESVQLPNNTRAIRTALELWDGYRVYLHAV